MFKGLEILKRYRNKENKLEREGKRKVNHMNFKTQENFKQ